MFSHLIQKLLIAGVFSLLCLNGAWASSQQGPEIETSRPLKLASFPSLESAIRLKGPVTFCGEPVPIHVPEVRERLEKELLLMLWDRAQVILWLKRSGRYFPYIETSLGVARMPDDLKFLPVIESALRPSAGSRRGACGLWQFIASTGRNYGLTVTHNVDERRNFRLATQAAMQYLQKLHEMFSSWALAIAAYNMGEEGLQQRIEQQDVTHYYQLDLPYETERYVLRAVAAKLIMSSPESYGFQLYSSDYYRPREYDRVRLKLLHAVPLVLVAQAAKTHYKMIKDMNPQYISDMLPRGANLVFLPKGAAQGLRQRYERLVERYRKQSHGKLYRVGQGDTLLKIARTNQIPLWKLLKINKLKRGSIIQPGQELVIKQ